MKRIVVYSVVVLIVAIPAVLLARTLVPSNENQLESLIEDIEDERFDAFLNSASFQGQGLIVSAGSDRWIFDEFQVEDARSVLDDATGIGSAGEVRLRQQRITVREDRATAILSVQVDDGDYVGLRVNLTNQEGQWLVDQIRVMS